MATKNVVHVHWLPCMTDYEVLALADTTALLRSSNTREATCEACLVRMVELVLERGK